ncbi:MAG TPA: hypothetical protein VFV74_00220 [Burkholderiales bacterium]|nr:hypothetical protein [Burkholderiales bacterium]
MRPIAFAVAVSLAAAAQAQTYVYKPTPVNRCDFLASPRLGGSEGGSNASPLQHELVPQLGEALAACEQAVKDQPKAVRLYGYLARVRALAGDAEGARAMARRGTEAGSLGAEIILAVFLAKDRDYGGAREHLKHAAQWVPAYANYNLGVLAANGWGMENEEAQAFFYRAARSGDPLAMQIFAQRFDAANAQSWLRKAAEAMNPDAEGNPFRIAAGPAVLDAAALVAWYEGKARIGEPWAQAYLGLLAEAGQWRAQDYAAAAQWYARAGEAGYVPAQWRLARLYREGRGVPRDADEARRWDEMWQVQRCDALERAEPGASACDRLAADRYDPQRVVAGVDSYCMRRFAERAVAACAAAVKQSPGTVRFHTQLARAFAHTGRFAEARREAGVAAAKGSSASMILLGVMSQRGLGGEADRGAAAAWYGKAADTGDERGAALAGRTITHRAPSLAEQAAKGDPVAQHNLATELEREERYADALRWYERAAAKGYGVSALNAAQMYEMGLGVPKNAGEARKRYRALAARGDGEALYRVAKLAAQAGDFEEAVHGYSRRIRDNDTRAMLDLGEMYEHGRGVKKDARRAAQLYERAAEPSAWARAKLGILYLQGGEGLPKDYAQARHWLERASADGNASARNNLGVVYERGLGVKVDYRAARDLYLAGLGDEHARGNLERMFTEGTGAPADPAAAFEWYRPGADAGIASAQYRIGHMYATGEGVPRDAGLAERWLIKANEQGHPQARKEIVALLRSQGRLLEADMFERQPLPESWHWGPDGISSDPGEDALRSHPLRAGNVGMAQSAAGDAAIANPYEIIRWFPESDGKK